MATARRAPAAFVLSRPVRIIDREDWCIVDNSGAIRDPAAACEAMQASRDQRQAVADDIAPGRRLFTAVRLDELARHGLTWPLLPRGQSVVTIEAQ